MNGSAFTLAMYRVKPGQEKTFIALWNQLADLFVSLPNPPVWGTLIQSVSDPSLFYSFGPWPSADDVRTMRADARAGEMFGRIGELCDELNPGDFQVITHVDVAERRSAGA